MKYKTFVFSGPPLSGKDTQANILSEKTGFQKFSTGERFRALGEEDTFLGKKIREVHSSGKLMPAWLADFIVQEKMLKLDPKEGIIFSGGVRTPEETKVFYELMGWLDRSFKIIYLYVPKEELQRRIDVRREDQVRNDDDQLETRLREFETLTVPSIDFLEKKGVDVIKVDGAQEVSVIQDQIWDEIKDSI